MNKITITKFDSAEKVDHNLSIDQCIGTDYAKAGYPYAVEIQRGNQGQTVHFSEAELKAIIAGYQSLNDSTVHQSWVAVRVYEVAAPARFTA